MAIITLLVCMLIRGQNILCFIKKQIFCRLNTSVSMFQWLPGSWRSGRPTNIETILLQLLSILVCNQSQRTLYGYVTYNSSYPPWTAVTLLWESLTTCTVPLITRTTICLQVMPLYCRWFQDRITCCLFMVQIIYINCSSVGMKGNVG